MYEMKIKILIKPGEKGQNGKKKDGIKKWCFKNLSVKKIIRTRKRLSFWLLSVKTSDKLRMAVNRHLKMGVCLWSKCKDVFLRATRRNHLEFLLVITGKYYIKVDKFWVINIVYLFSNCNSYKESKQICFSSWLKVLRKTFISMVLSGNIFKMTYDFLKCQYTYFILKSHTQATIIYILVQS